MSQVEETEHTELLFGPRGLITRTSVGSLFLNNIDQLSVPAQKALAQFMVSGSLALDRSQPSWGKVDLRTSGDLKQQVSKGAFREDLYFELSVAELARRRCGTGRKTSRKWPAGSAAS